MATQTKVDLSVRLPVVGCALDVGEWSDKADERDVRCLNVFESL